MTRRRARSSVLVIIVLLALGTARGDGGLLRLKQTAAPYDISVFTAPTPLRAGTIDVSVMVLRLSDQAPVLDAAVQLELRGPGGELTATATSAAATNKLLYAALIDVPVAGRWTISARVRGGDSDVTVGTEIAIEPALSPAWAFWPYLALPAVAIALFVLNQWLKSEGRTGR